MNFSSAMRWPMGLMAAGLLIAACGACSRLAGLSSGEAKFAVSAPGQSTGHRDPAEADSPPAFSVLPPEGG